VPPPRDGWVAVYEESTSWQDHEAICRIGQTLSERLDTHLVAFLVHDSDVLRYWLYERGELLDGYTSHPDYFGQHVDESAREQCQGRPGVLARYCLRGTTEDAIREVLQGDVRSGVFADD